MSPIVAIYLSECYRNSREQNTKTYLKKQFSPIVLIYLANIPKKYSDQNTKEKNSILGKSLQKNIKENPVILGGFTSLQGWVYSMIDFLSSADAPR